MVTQRHTMEPNTADCLASGPPSNFGISPSVPQEYTVSIPTYLQANPTIGAVCVGAVVFRPTSCKQGTEEADALERHGPSVLLLQRAAHDFAGLMWEVPGGACEADKDATILHAVARELWEETGLRLTGVKRLVDYVEFPGGPDKPWMVWRKITFEVEVEGDDGLTLEKGTDKANTEGLSLGVTIDPNEHQDWGWAKESEARNGAWEKGKLEFMELQKKTILELFERRRL